MKTGYYRQDFMLLNIFKKPNKELWVTLHILINDEEGRLIAGSELKKTDKFSDVSSIYDLDNFTYLGDMYIEPISYKGINVWEFKE